MARKVFVSSDMSVDERLVEVAEKDGQSVLLWPWILTAFDDWGRAEANPKRLKAQLFPMVDLVTAEVVEKAIYLFASCGLIQLYRHREKTYMCIQPDKWFKYQTHIRSSKREKDDSRHPAPSEENLNAHLRADTRSNAQVSEDARICTPSPSLSLSPSLSKERKRIMGELARYFPHGMPNRPMQDILDYMDKGLGLELLDKAFEIANGQLPKNKAAYMAGVLQGFLNDGIMTIAQYEARESQRQIATTGGERSEYPRRSGTSGTDSPTTRKRIVDTPGAY